MRKAFLTTLQEIAEKDPRVMLLTADLGYAFLEPFAAKMPQQFLNVGVAEQNLLGLANGLAKEGFLPFVYSIATFAVLRSYEFLRNGPGAHNFPVRVVGIGSGVDYSHDGLTHHSLEDIGVLRVLPTFEIVAPCDANQARTALLKTWDRPHPIYYRISKNEQVVVPNLNGDFTFGQLNLIRSGKDCVLFATGIVAAEVMAAAQLLHLQGIECAVACVSTLQPCPSRELLYLLSGYRYAFSYETHYQVGGLGSMIAEVIAESNLGCQLIRHGLEYRPSATLGTQEFLHQRNHLDRDSIVERVRSFVNTR